MSKAGSANGSFFGNFISDQLLRRPPAQNMKNSTASL